MDDCLHADIRKNSLIWESARVQGGCPQRTTETKLIKGKWSLNIENFFISKLNSERNYNISLNKAEIANVTPIMNLDENIPWNLNNCTNEMRRS